MKQTKIEVTNERYRLGYHLMPASGWMNDPNGFSYYNGYYHLFYQYYPYAAEWGPMHWGHARSKDLIHWETLPVALVPTRPQDGCFSGSAVAFDDRLWLIYTGNHVIDKEKDINRQDQNLAYSADGIRFEKYDGNPILAEAPSDNNPADFRDPKVWQEDDGFRMVVGSRDKDGLGRVLLYSSRDLKQWDYVGAIAGAESVEHEGFMWECPDFFRLNGQDVLLLSPQGIEATDEKFINQHNTGYFVGNYLEDEKRFEHGEFVELDNGHDLYATQTRELTIRNNHLYQSPVAEVRSLRKAELVNRNLVDSEDLVLGRHVEFRLDLDDLPEGKIIEVSDGEDNGFSISADRGGRHLVLVRSVDPENKRYAELDEADEKLSLHVFIDSSSAEIFVNDGEVTFTERIYWRKDPTLSVSGKSGHIQAFELSADANRY